MGADDSDDEDLVAGDGGEEMSWTTDNYDSSFWEDGQAAEQGDAASSGDEDGNLLGTHSDEEVRGVQWCMKAFRVVLGGLMLLLLWRRRRLRCCLLGNLLSSSLSGGRQPQLPLQLLTFQPGLLRHQAGVCRAPMPATLDRPYHLCSVQEDDDGWSVSAVPADYRVRPFVNQVQCRWLPQWA